MDENTITRDEFDAVMRMQREITEIKVTAARIEAKLDIMSASLAAMTTPPRRSGW